MLEVDGIYRGYFQAKQDHAIFRVITPRDDRGWVRIDYFTERDGFYSDASIQDNDTYERVPFHEWALCVMKGKYDHS